MKLTELDNHTISMNDFSLKWRFTEEEYDVLPKEHLDELRPLDKIGSEFINDYLNSCQIHAEIPFKKDLFRNLDRAKILNGNEKYITKWLYQRAIPFDRKVYLSWDNQTGMITKWKFVVKYWDSLFYGGGSDDLTVFDQSMEWSILFFHEDEIYFGTNKDYNTKKEFNENEFCYHLE